METLSEQDDKYIKGFSWAAFFGTWVYLFLNKQNKLGWKIFLLFIFNQLFSFLPFFMAPVAVVSQIEQLSKILSFIYFGVCIWLAIRGREMIWKNKIYSSVEEFKQKQLRINKYITSYIIILVILMFVSMFFMLNKIAKNPEIIDQKIEQQAFLKVKADNPNLNEQEFGQGYQKGLAEGRTDVEPSFMADQTSSHQDGYRFGYSIACMEVHNSQAYCIKKFMDVPKTN